jgi:membrane protein
MSDQHPPAGDGAARSQKGTAARRGPGGLVKGTLKRAWHGSIFSEAA